MTAGPVQITTAARITTTAKAGSRHEEIPAHAQHAAFGHRLIGWVLTVAGLLGAAAACALTIDKLRLLADPAYVPSCSVNPLLSCGPIMGSPQAQVFGFPNPLLGMIAFPVVAATGVLVLGGARPPRWFWLAMHAGASAGLLFIHWLIYQSLYRIQALCPYCMVVWVVTITIFCYLSFHLVVGRSLGSRRWARAAARVAHYHSTVLTVWLLAVVGLIAHAFWLHWVALFTALIEN